MEPPLRTEFHKDQQKNWLQNFQNNHLKLQTIHNNEIYKENQLNENPSGFTLFNSDWFTDTQNEKFVRQPKVFNSPFFQESSSFFEPFKIPERFLGFRKHSPIWFEINDYY